MYHTVCMNIKHFYDVCSPKYLKSFTKRNNSRRWQVGLASGNFTSAAL